MKYDIISIMDTNEFIKRATNKHSTLYNYTMTEYVDNKTKVTIQCNTCLTTFSMLPSSHIYKQGCPKCRYTKSGSKKRIPKEEFVIRLQQIYGDKLLYDDVDYTKVYNKVTISCYIHGPFTKLGQYLLDNKISCPECVLLHKKDKTNRLGGYTLDRVEQHPNSPASLYIVELSNDNEHFFKVGITTQPLHYRFPKMGVVGYKVRPIVVETLTLKEVFLKEQLLLTQFNKFQYIPLNKFDGYTECLSINPLL